MARNDARLWMWPEACVMLAKAERLQLQFFHVAETEAGRPAWEPPADVFETDAACIVMVALPGIDPAAIHTSIDDGVLIIAGHRPLPAQLHGAMIHRMELPQGRFERRLALPRGRYGDAHCATANGCLIVTLSKIS